MLQEKMDALLMHDRQKCTKVSALIHSQEGSGIQKIWIAIKKIDEVSYLALVNGTFCTAIYNPFTGLYYADDIYGVIPVSKRN